MEWQEINDDMGWPCHLLRVFGARVLVLRELSGRYWINGSYCGLVASKCLKAKNLEDAKREAQRMVAKVLLAIADELNATPTEST